MNVCAESLATRGAGHEIVFGVYVVALAMLLVTVSSCANRAPRTRALAVSVSPPPCGTSMPSDVLTQHGDCQRTGAVLNEQELNPASVQSGRFGRLFGWEVDGQIYTQPLYVSNVMHDGRLINLVIVATMNNSVYAFEAPPRGSVAQPSRGPFWRVGSEILGKPVPVQNLAIQWRVFGLNIDPTVGITATPVIDRSRQRIYVTAKSLTGRPKPNDISYDLYALNLLSGKLLVKEHIDPVATSTGFTWHFDASHHLQRPSLLEANDRIYVAFGSHQDTKNYHGWVVAYDADTLKPKGTLCTTCGHEVRADCQSSCMGGIWQAGAGPAVDNEGNLYLITGNGTFEQTKNNWGTSFIKLSKDLVPIATWTPPHYDCLNRTDADLGSAGPLYLSDVSVLIGGGKEGVLYALGPAAFRASSSVGSFNPNLMGVRPCDKWRRPMNQGMGYSSIQASPLWEPNLMDLFRFFNDGLAAPGFHHIHGAPVQWKVRTGSGQYRRLIYISAERDLLRAFEFNQSWVGPTSIPGDPPSDTYESSCKNSERGMPGGFLTLSAHGDDPTTGIVWANMPRYDMDALNHFAPGILRAYRAYPENTGKLTELWNSDYGVVRSSVCNPSGKKGPDQVSTFAKFVPPTVADGKVYVSTFLKQVAVYGLRPNGVHAMATLLHDGYDAELEIGDLPRQVKAGSAVSVSVTVYNRGTNTWRTNDDLQLVPQNPLGMDYVPVEGEKALSIDKDVAPQNSYTFHFHLKVPLQEETNYVTWRLRRIVRDTGAPENDWFAIGNEEWTFATLRPECNGVRERARAALAQFRDTPASPGSPRDLAATISASAITDEAGQKQCSLDPEIIDPAAMSH